VRFAAEVPVRWSDMDAYGHVNHARVVTLLEAARVELFHSEMLRRGLKPATDEGLVVSSLAVDYLAPIVFDGSPLRIELWVAEVRAASFLLRYEIRGFHEPRVLVKAQTRMVPYDLEGSRLRRIGAEDREFLALWGDDGA
jgi:acyl-CoA thioester hydrolase